MRKIIRRDDLLNKSQYSKQYGVNRVSLDKMIEDGKLIVEEISGIHYIKIK